MVAMRSWIRPRGAHHASFPAMRISMPSSMRPAPAALITALTVGRSLARSVTGMTASGAAPSGPGSASSK